MSQARCLGIVRIGTLALAIPAEQLQEVVSDPLPLSPLPDAPGFVLGQTILHERETAPVIDLQKLLSPDAPAGPRPPLLVFLHHDIGRVAIPADAVLKVFYPRPEQFTKLETAAEVPLFRESVRDGDQVINILEVGALSEYSGMRFAAANLATTVTEGHEDMTTFTLFQLGALTFGLEINATSNAMLVPDLNGSQIPSPLLHGFFALRGRQIALLNLRHLLELPADRSTKSPTRMLAVEHGGQTFAVGITDVLGMERLRVSQIEPLAGCGLPAAGLYRGSVHSPAHGQVLILNPEAIFAHQGVRNLLSIHDCVANAQSKPDFTERLNYIVFRAGGSSLATRMDQLQAVIAYPTDFVALRTEKEPFLGFFTWQKRVIALMDLGILLGALPTAIAPHSTRVLIAHQGGQYIGYLVQRVDSLQETAPKPLPRFAATGKFPKGASGSVPLFNQMISVRTTQNSLNAPVLDLDQVRTSPPPTSSTTLNTDTSTNAPSPSVELVNS